MEQVKELVLLIARALVDAPDQVKVNVVESANSIIIELSVSKDDTGKIIGKQGRTADAVRTILNAVSGKTRKHVTLEIIDRGRTDDVQ